MRRHDQGQGMTATTAAERPARLYTFVIVAMAVFLVGLLVWRNPVVGYRASAIVRVTSPQEWTGDLRSWTASEVEQYRVNHATPEEIERLRLDVLPPESLGIVEVRLSLVHPDRDLGPEIVATAARRLAALINRGTEASESPGSLSLGIEPADASVAAVEQQWAEFVDQKLAEVGQWQAAVRREIEAENHPAAVTSTKPNPRKRQLAIEIQELQEREAFLAKTLNAAHPNLREVRGDLESLKREWANTPATETVSQAAPRKAITLPPSLPIGTWQAEAEQLRAAAQAARAEYTTRWRERIDGIQLPELPVGGPQAAIHEPAMGGTAIGGGPSALSLAILALLAGAAGGAAAWFSGEAAKIDAFTSAEEVAETTRAPVIATLNTADGPDLPEQPGGGAVWVPRIVRGSEIVLALLLFGFILALVFRSPLTTQFALDPLGAFVEALRF